ncbi:MAG TPA: HD domain-containing protein [Polyangia bacterium]|jgi:(p)ppGpp synthase/HD superfamily hydrolase
MPLSRRFIDALEFAAELHQAQVRKGSGIPYVAHLLGVASIALEYGADEDEAIAGLLHDAIEDQGGDATRAEIRRRFGDRVTAIVDGCTDTDEHPKPPWRERKERHLQALGAADASIRLVMAADKLQNARSMIKDFRTIGAPLWERFRGGRDGSLWYLRAMTERLHAAGPTALTAELLRVVAEVERLAG